MARIVFETDIAADRDALVRALTTREGIAGWWTDQVTLDGGVGATMQLGFPIAPVPFELTIQEASPERVVWRSTGEFPPHWADTSVIWTLTANDDGGTKVHFNHDGWASDDGPLPMSAYTWAQLLGTLSEHVTSGSSAPLFTSA